jgi:EpsI family protein
MLASNLSQGKVSVVMPDSQGDWEEEAARWDWRPASRVSGQQLGFYELAGDPLVVYVQFAGDTPGGEDVVGSSTLFAREDDQAIVIGQENESIVVLGHSIEVDEAQIRIPGQELLVWSWYVVGDVSTSNDYLAKLKQVAVKLGLTEEVAYRIILATPYLASSSDSRVLLQRFLDEHASLLYEKLHQPGVILP